MKQGSYTLDEFANAVNERLTAIVSMQALFYNRVRATDPELIAAFADNLSEMITRARIDAREVPDMEWIHKKITTTSAVPLPPQGPKLRIVDPE